MGQFVYEVEARSTLGGTLVKSQACTSKYEAGVLSRKFAQDPKVGHISVDQSLPLPGKLPEGVTHSKDSPAYLPGHAETIAFVLNGKWRKRYGLLIEFEKPFPADIHTQVMQAKANFDEDPDEEQVGG